MTTSNSQLDTKMGDLLNSCRSVNTLHPLISDLCQLPEFKQIFWDSLNQDLHVICQRSQILAHGEITVFQKAFATLMQKKEDIIPAIHLYVDEILGLKFVPESERATSLNIMIQTKHTILGQAYSSTSKDLASRSNDGDEKLKRLFIIYHKARKDFDATPAKTLERTKSAKFLRDTTENCLTYIAAKQTRSGDSEVEATCDGKMLNELRATLEKTIVIAEQGSGGKKRRFDENWQNVPQGPTKMRDSCVAQPLVNGDPIPRGQTLEKKRKPTTFWIQEREAGYTKARTNMAQCRRSDLSQKLHPASARNSVHRVFGDRYKPHAERKTSEYQAHPDRYRPTYR